MYTHLYQYLLRQKQLHVPGIGTFLLERKSATADFVNRQIHPPRYSLALQPNGNPNPTYFFNWLGAALEISEREAVVRFNDFAFDLKRKIAEGDTIDWKGVGTLNKGFGEKIKFTPAERLVEELPVPAEKIIRERAEHTVRVGEDEKTSAEMIEFFRKLGDKKHNWWALALILGILLIVFMGWYFSRHGISAESAGNTMKLEPVESGEVYKIIP